MARTVALLLLVAACAVTDVQTQAPRLPERPNGVPSKADLYLVNANMVDPATQDVHRGSLLSNTQRIAYVIHHGVIVDREGLRADPLAGLTR